MAIYLKCININEQFLNPLLSLLNYLEPPSLTNNTYFCSWVQFSNQSVPFSSMSSFLMYSMTSRTLERREKIQKKFVLNPWLHNHEPVTWPLNHHSNIATHRLKWKKLRCWRVPHFPGLVFFFSSFQASLSGNQQSPLKNWDFTSATRSWLFSFMSEENRGAGFECRRPFKWLVMKK